MASAQTPIIDISDLVAQLCERLGNVPKTVVYRIDIEPDRATVYAYATRGQKVGVGPKYIDETGKAATEKPLVFLVTT